MNWIKRIFYDEALIRWKIAILEDVLILCQSCGHEEKAEKYKEEINRLKSILK